MFGKQNEEQEDETPKEALEREARICLTKAFRGELTPPDYVLKAALACAGWEDTDE
jgi:hypothetical protein